MSFSTSPPCSSSSEGTLVTRVTSIRHKAFGPANSNECRNLRRHLLHPSGSVDGSGILRCIIGQYERGLKKEQDRYTKTYSSSFEAEIRKSYWNRVPPRCCTVSCRTLVMYAVICLVATRSNESIEIASVEGSFAFQSLTSRMKCSESSCQGGGIDHPRSHTYCYRSKLVSAINQIQVSQLMDR